MQVKGQTSNRESSLGEEKHNHEAHSTLPPSRPTCPPAFSFQNRPFREETAIQRIENGGVEVGSSVEQTRGLAVQRWHGQSHQEVDHPDDSAHQLPRGTITARVLANLGLREEKEREVESIQSLIEALQSSDSSIRVASIHELIQHRAQINESVHLYLQVEFAKMALLQCDWPQRIAAIKAIGVWGGPRAISALKICLQHPYEYVRAAAAQAIADIGIRTDLEKRLSDAISTLLVASSDRHWVVRIAVIQAMRTLGRQNVGRQEFINAVILALDDEECMVRVAAVRALYDLKGVQVLPRLALIAKRDQEYLVREAAQDIVEEISLQ